MSALNDLIAQIADSTLRERIQHEVDRLYIQSTGYLYALLCHEYLDAKLPCTVNKET